MRLDQPSFFYSKVLLLGLLLISTPLKAQLEGYISGEGKFLATEEDGQSDIKKQLLYNAFQDVMNREMKAMGLDSVLFWRKYDEKFEDFFKSQEEKIRQTYGEEAKGKKKVEMENALRQKRQNMRLNFGRISRSVQSYSIKKMTRSTQNPNLRYLSISAKVNREALGQIYRRFTTEGKFKNFSTLYFSISYQLKEGAWSDLGVDSEGELTRVVNDHWKKLLEENLKGEVDEIALIDHAQARSFQDQLGAQAVMDVAQKWSDSHLDMAGSLWLKMVVSVTKLKEGTVGLERSFKIGGDYLLLDLGTGQNLSSGDFAQNEHSYPVENRHSLSSAIANTIYNMPKEEWSDLRRQLAQATPGLSLMAVSVSNLNSIEDLMKLKEFLSQRGAAKQLKPQLSSYSGGSGELSLSFPGNGQELGAFLLSLDELKISDTKMISFRSKSTPFLIELKDVAMATSPSTQPSQMPSEAHPNEKGE